MRAVALSLLSLVLAGSPTLGLCQSAAGSPMQRAIQALPKEISVTGGGDFRNATIENVEADHLCLQLAPDPKLEAVMRAAKIERESKPFTRCYPFTSILWWNGSSEGRPAMRLSNL